MKAAHNHNALAQFAVKHGDDFRLADEQAADVCIALGKRDGVRAVRLREIEFRDVAGIEIHLKTAVGPVFEAEKQGVLLWKVATAEQLKTAHPSKAHFLLKSGQLPFLGFYDLHGRSAQMRGGHETNFPGN